MKGTFEILSIVTFGYLTVGSVVNIFMTDAFWGILAFLLWLIMWVAVGITAAYIYDKVKQKYGQWNGKTFNQTSTKRQSLGH